MIGVFPKPYEDELAYSVFARYLSMSGYQCYTSVAEDLYVNSKNKPSIELINALTQDAINHIVPSLGSLDDFILNHTMFNYYSAFLSNIRKQQAFEYALQMDIKSLMNALPIPQSKASRYLRYCPLCAKEDRDLYGETFWHRAHQINGVNVCYKHECYLIDSNISISSNASPSLIKAESTIKETNTIIKALPTEIDIAKYNIEILNHKHSSTMIYNDFPKNFNAYLVGTKYLSKRGAKRYIEVLSNDFKNYYKDVNLCGFGESWQLEKVFNGRRSNPFEISLVGMFLGIQAKEFVSCERTIETKTTSDFDNTIKELKASGLNYREIAAKLGISYDYCKALAYGKKSGENRKRTHNGGRKINWEYLDEQTLPNVIKLIKEMEAFNNSRPQKVSIGKIERLLNLKEYQLKKMSKCLEYVNSHIISQQEFWALTIVWALKELETQNKTINITNILRLTNIRKAKLECALPYLSKYIDKDFKQYELFSLD